MGRPLTDLDVKQGLNAVTFYMGSNGAGLLYNGAMMDVAKEFPTRTEKAWHQFIRRQGERYGMEQETNGNILLESVLRGDAKLDVSIPKPRNVTMAYDEVNFLQVYAPLILAGGGHYRGARIQTQKELCLTEGGFMKLSKSLRNKLGVSNLEQASIAAVVQGIIAKRQVEHTKAYEVLKHADWYQDETPVRLRIGDEQILSALQSIIEDAGGLFWKGMIQKAAGTADTHPSVTQDRLVRLTTLYGLAGHGQTVYKFARQNGNKVQPKRVQGTAGNLSNTERLFLIRSAQDVLPTAGFTTNGIQGIYERLEKDGVVTDLEQFHTLKKGIERKFNIRTIGKLVSFAIQERLILPWQVVGKESSPALEAILDSHFATG